MRRREFLTLAALLAAGGSFAGFWLNRTSQAPRLLSARDDANGQHYAVSYALDGRAEFVTPIGQRAHDIAIHPQKPLAVWVARRPGTQSHLIDLQTGRLLQVLTTLPLQHGKRLPGTWARSARYLAL